MLLYSVASLEKYTIFFDSLFIIKKFTFNEKFCFALFENVAPFLVCSCMYLLSVIHIEKLAIENSSVK